MKQDDQIFDLFKKNEHKLEEMPSLQAWDRLEERLDERKDEKKGFVLRKVAIAAAVFIAVSMIAIWTYVNPFNYNNERAAFHSNKAPSPIERIASDANERAVPLLMSHREKAVFLTEAVRKTNPENPPIANKKPGNNVQSGDRIKPGINEKEVKETRLPAIADVIERENAEIRDKKLQKDEESDLFALKDFDDENDGAVIEKEEVPQPETEKMIVLADLEEEVEAKSVEKGKTKAISKADLPEATDYDYGTDQDDFSTTIVTEYEPIRSKAEEKRRDEMLQESERRREKKRRASKKAKTMSEAIAQNSAKDKFEEVAKESDEAVVMEEHLAVVTAPTSASELPGSPTSFAWLIGEWNSQQNNAIQFSQASYMISGSGEFSQGDVSELSIDTRNNGQLYWSGTELFNIIEQTSSKIVFENTEKDSFPNRIIFTLINQNEMSVEQQDKNRTEVQVYTRK